MFILKPVLTDADYKSTGILQRIHTLRVLTQKKHIRIADQPRTNQLVQLHHIILKNPESKTQNV